MPTRVYSPDGEPFDIPRHDHAVNLILEEGWTQTAPVSVPVEEEAPKPKKRASRRKSKVEPEPKAVEAEEADDAPSDDE